jgi:hypothetical protein
MTIAYARPGVKVLKGRNIRRFTLVFDLVVLLVRRRSLSLAEIGVLGAVTAPTFALSRVWILLRYEQATVDAVISRCLTMTRTPFRRKDSLYIATISGDQLVIDIVSPLPTVGVLTFEGNWRYTKALVVRQLLGKSLEPVVPRLVVRLGERHANGS